ncbi:hypothetical protein C8R43DRAFT_1140612 [Mycena crocata]|nr:hypothetical protein C8R43DRAFT_1140612 [Mycena crocata]
MTRTPSTPAALPFTALPAVPAGFAMGFMPIFAIPILFPLAALPVAAPTEPLPEVKAEVKQEKTVAPLPAATKPVPGAGLPARLQALLRTDGPFLANEVFSIVPAQELDAVDEEEPAPEWCAITWGRFVGVVDQLSVYFSHCSPSMLLTSVSSALSEFAIRGVTHCARKTYLTQALALDAFNKVLGWGGVEIP